MEEWAYLFPLPPNPIQLCKHIVNILYRRTFLGVPCPPCTHPFTIEILNKMCLHMLTFRTGIGMGCEQACQDLRDPWSNMFITDGSKQTWVILTLFYNKFGILICLILGATQRWAILTRIQLELIP